MGDQDRSDKIKCVIRIVNLVTGGIMVGFGVLGIIMMAVNNVFNGKFFLIFSPAFMILFGLVVVAAQCKLEFITSKFGFLQSLIGRGIFNIYLSSTVFYYFSCGGMDIVWLGWVVASIMFAVGIIYIILNFCGGKAYQDQKTEKDTKEQMM